MIRKALWIAIGWFPLLVISAMYLFSPEIIDRFITSSPGNYTAIEDWLLTYWWLILLVFFLIHFVFFILHPFFNRQISGMFYKICWAMANLLVWPFTSAIYVLFFTRKFVSS